MDLVVHDDSGRDQSLSQASLTQPTDVALVSFAALLPRRRVVKLLEWLTLFHTIKKAPVSPTPRVKLRSAGKG